MTADDIYKMSSAQLVASWKMSTGILQNKIELMSHRLDVSESLAKHRGTLLEKYLAELEATKQGHSHSQNNNTSSNNTGILTATPEKMMMNLMEVNRKIEQMNLTQSKLMQQLATLTQNTGNIQHIENNKDSNS